MNDARFDQRQKEFEYLEEEKKKYPDLFPEITSVDDSQILEKFGIHIPNKASLPQAYLKLMPSDFIVEEIAPTGSISEVSEEDLHIEDSEGNTVYATLVKCGISTLEAVEDLRVKLGASKDQIRYAGLKDKDALTSQTLSFRNIPKELIKEVSSPYFFLKNIHTGKGVMEKGGLKGNRFNIFLRTTSDFSTPEHQQALTEALKTVQEKGFYNFFYLQRFGTPRLISYHLGISILKGNYKKALEDQIIEPGIRENPYFKNIRKECKDLLPDIEAVINKLTPFPLIFNTELKALYHLQKYPGDYVGALRQIEDQVTLWVHSVSSILHNRKLSSYLMAGMEPPHSLPQFLSPDKNDWLTFVEDLEAVGIFPPDLSTIKPFRNIIPQKRTVETRDKADIHGVEVTDQGIAISFSLQKGEYATTFLSHFVNLLGGHVPEDIQSEVVDIKKLLGFNSIEGILEKFSSLNISKKI